MNQKPTPAMPMPRSDDVLIKAIRRVQAALGLTHEQLLSILKISSLEDLDAASEEGKRAATLISIYQRLCAYVGDNKTNLHHWVSTHNRYLGTCPVDVMSTDSGLDQVIVYLNSRR